MNAVTPPIVLLFMFIHSIVSIWMNAHSLPTVNSSLIWLSHWMTFLNCLILFLSVKIQAASVEAHDCKLFSGSPSFSLSGDLLVTKPPSFHFLWSLMKANQTFLLNLKENAVICHMKGVAVMDTWCTVCRFRQISRFSWILKHLNLALSSSTSFSYSGVGSWTHWEFFVFVFTLLFLYLK